MPARLYCFNQVMKKNYICRLSATNILVNINSVVKRVWFEPDIINGYGLRGCSYTTDNKEIQSAIENHPQFRNGARDSITIYGGSFEKPEPVPVVEKPVVKRGKAKKEE